MSVQLNTLVDDIYSVLSGAETTITDEAVDTLATRVSLLLKDKLSKGNEPARLRMSNLGTPNRKLWYNLKATDATPHTYDGPTLLKFLYGDLIEVLVLWLAEQAGHAVTDQQKVVEVDGVKGSMDCKIDGVLLDVKTASPISYKKFESKQILRDDPFGYVSQLAGYYHADHGEDDDDDGQAGWLVVNKVSGEICLTLLDVLVLPSTKQRVVEVNGVLARDTPPDELCYPPVEKGKGGNEEIGFGCRYCEHKYKCYPDMRVFQASTGPVYLSKVVKEPRMEEITK